MEMDSSKDKVTRKETHMGVKERVPRGGKQALGREEWRYLVSNRSPDVDFILSACNSGAGRPLSKLLRKGNWRLRTGISQPPVMAIISTNKILPPQNKPSSYRWPSLKEFSLVFLLSSLLPLALRSHVYSIEK